MMYRIEGIACALLVLALVAGSSAFACWRQGGAGRDVAAISAFAATVGTAGAVLFTV